MKHKGFSLIELIVMIAVMGLLAGGAVVFINRFNAQQRFTSSLEKTITQLRLARNYAVTLQTPKADGNLTAVVVTVGAGGTMTAIPHPNADPPQNYFSVKVVEVGVTVANTTVRFAPVTGKLLNDTYGLTTGETTISFSSVELGINNVSKIRISASGIISEM